MERYLNDTQEEEDEEVEDREKVTGIGIQLMCNNATNRYENYPVIYFRSKLYFPIFKLQASLTQAYNLSITERIDEKVCRDVSALYPARAHTILPCLLDQASSLLEPLFH